MLLCPKASISPRFKPTQKNITPWVLYLYYIIKSIIKTIKRFPKTQTLPCILGNPNAKHMSAQITNCLRQVFNTIHDDTSLQNDGSGDGLEVY